METENLYMNSQQASDTESQIVPLVTNMWFCLEKKLSLEINLWLWQLMKVSGMHIGQNWLWAQKFADFEMDFKKELYLKELTRNSCTLSSE